MKIGKKIQKNKLKMLAIGKIIQKEDTTCTETDTKKIKIHYCLKNTDENNVILFSK